MNSHVHAYLMTSEMSEQGRVDEKVGVGEGVWLGLGATSAKEENSSQAETTRRF